MCSCIIAIVVVSKVDAIGCIFSTTYLCTLLIGTHVEWPLVTEPPPLTVHRKMSAVLGCQWNNSDFDVTRRHVGDMSATFPTKIIR